MNIAALAKKERDIDWIFQHSGRHMEKILVHHDQMLGKQIVQQPLIACVLWITTYKLYVNVTLSLFLQVSKCVIVVYGARWRDNMYYNVKQDKY